MVCFPWIEVNESANSHSGLLGSAVGIDRATAAADTPSTHIGPRLLKRPENFVNTPVIAERSHLVGRYCDATLGCVRVQVAEAERIYVS